MTPRPFIAVAGCLCFAGLLSGCVRPLQPAEFMAWDVPGQIDATVPLESGQIIVSSSDQPLDLFATLLPSRYNPYIHAAVLSIENGRAFVYEEYGRHWINPFAESPTDAVTGRVKRVPLRKFLARYDHIEIWRAGDYDQQAVASWARQQYELKTPFDPYFDHGETERLYCTEFVALALEAGGASPFTPVPNRENRSAQVVLDWLRIPPALLQANTLIASGQRVATLSVNHTLIEIRVMDEIKRELYRRFTCDQKVGNLFNVAGPSILLRDPVAQFITAALYLYPAEAPLPDAETLRSDVARLAMDIFGPYAGDAVCRRSVSAD